MRNHIHILSFYIRFETQKEWQNRKTKLDWNKS